MSINGLLGVPPPPTDAQRRAELADVHALTDHRTAAEDTKALALDLGGDWALWQREAALYTAHVGPIQGAAGTAEMNAAIAQAAAETEVAKVKYGLQRPFEMDPTITPLGGVPWNPSYPSGHAAAAAAAATVLEHLWPENAAKYESMMKDVEWARVYSGVHFPSDVKAGEELGKRVGEMYTDIPSLPTFDTIGNWGHSLFVEARPPYAPEPAPVAPTAAYAVGR